MGRGEGLSAQDQLTVYPAGGQTARQADLGRGVIRPAQVHKTLQMGGGTPVVSLVYPAQQSPGGAYRQGGGQMSKVLGRKGVGPVRSGLKAAQRLLPLGGKKLLVSPQALGGVCQPSQKAGIEGLQLWQHPVAQPVSGVDVLPVGGILPPGKSPEAQIGLNFLPGGGEKGADNGSILGGHAAQPPQAGAAGQVEQDCLPVVIGRVGGGDPLGPRLPRRRLEKLIAHCPGGLLNAAAGLLGLGSHIAGSGEQRHRRENLQRTVRVDHPIPAAAQGHKLLDKLGVLGGLLPSELVVKVGGDQHKRE